MPLKRYHCYLSALAGYFTFGVLHELIHLACVYFSGLLNDANSVPVSWYTILFNILFLRRVSIDVVPTSNEDTMDTLSSLVESKAALVRHVGWISSLLLAIASHFLYHHRSNCEASTTSSCQLRSWFIFAGYITAHDAICTDLLELNPFLSYYGVHENVHNDDGDAIHLNFYCGNFGIILLHGAWLDKDGGKAALDILEKMVEG